jgi:hypothetical protein
VARELHFACFCVEKVRGIVVFSGGIPAKSGSIVVFPPGGRADEGVCVWWDVYRRPNLVRAVRTALAVRAPLHASPSVGIVRRTGRAAASRDGQLQHENGNKIMGREGQQNHGEGSGRPQAQTAAARRGAHATKGAHGANPIFSVYRSSFFIFMEDIVSYSDGSRIQM